MHIANAARQRLCSPRPELARQHAAIARQIVKHCAWYNLSIFRLNIASVVDIKVKGGPGLRLLVECKPTIQQNELQENVE